jgi:nitrite reductase/ring-hydroxylating ferredoxin subunit
LQQFVVVATAAEIEPGSLHQVFIGTREFVIANVDGEFFALDNSCSHEACPLSEGDLDGHELSCICHGSQFDVRTGEVLSPPALTPVKTYPVKVEDGNIMLPRP